MGHYIKDNLNDITYKSELILPSCFRKKAGGINSQTTYGLQLASFTPRKLSAHLK